MAIWTPAELHFLETVAKLAYTNPFYTERIALEKAALGKEFRPDGLVWSSSPSDPEAVNPNAWKIADRIEPLLMKARERLGEASNKESTLYEEGVHHLLYQRYYPEFISVSRKGWAFYKKLLADWEFFFHIGRKEFETQWQPEHLFACYWQVARAFHHIFDSIVGNSLQVARLRASVWESIFTYDARRYRRSLYLKMAEFPTLITGPSGSGKEIVARAIAGSRYVPFHAGRMMFEEPKEGIFAAINMAALSPALIESELFGHRRGAFTGAVGDRKGYLESCPAVGSVFLDELGELDMNCKRSCCGCWRRAVFSRWGMWWRGSLRAS